MTITCVSVVEWSLTQILALLHKFYIIHNITVQRLMKSTMKLRSKSNYLKLKLFPFSHLESKTVGYGLIFQQSGRLKMTKDY